MSRSKTLKRRRTLWVLTIAVCVSVSSQLAARAPSDSSHQAPRRRALLVGINDYTASRLRGAGPNAPQPIRQHWRNLKGAVNDVEAIRDVLEASFGFQEEDILLLTDQQATRGAIFRALDEHLIAPAKKGDLAVFYYSGHGSQVRNSKSDELDKMDETYVPADGPLGADDIRDKELRPLLNKVLSKGARLVVVLDKCYSGSGARGLPSAGRVRRLEPVLRDVADGSDYGPRPEEHGALVLAASQADQSAYEITTDDGRQHGAFTWALLQALRAASEGESAERVFLRARSWLRAADPFQEPVLAGTPEAQERPLFGGRADRQDGRTVVLAEGVEDDGTVVLRGGWANGLAVGSELRRIPGAKETDEELRLEVTTVHGLGRSSARVVKEGDTPVPSVVTGDLFEIVSWLAPQGSPLRVWIPQTDRPEAGWWLARGLRQLAAQGRFTWIEDPVAQRPSHVLRWHGEWRLLSLAEERTQALGTSTTPDEVASLLSPDARLFVHLPAPAALARQMELGPGTRHGAVEPVDDPAAAYHLVGRLRDHAVEYAWVRPGVGRDEDRRTGRPSYSAWQVWAEEPLRKAPAERLQAVSARLEHHVLQLAKIRDWYELTSPPGHAFAYRLRLRDEKTGHLVDRDALVAGRKYSIVLQLSPDRLSGRGYAPPRYVYVFGIDSTGRSFVFYPPLPWGNEQNHLPLDGGSPPEIELGADSSFRVVGPYGTDTLFLLTTAEPLLDIRVLEYKGVRARGPKGSHPLEELLSLTGGFRNFRRSIETSMKWSIERWVVTTAPAGDQGSATR